MKTILRKSVVRLVRSTTTTKTATLALNTCRRSLEAIVHYKFATCITQLTYSGQ